jgi:hypothetical protein
MHKRGPEHWRVVQGISGSGKMQAKWLGKRWWCPIVFVLSQALAHAQAVVVKEGASFELSCKHGQSHLSRFQSLFWHLFRPVLWHFPVRVLTFTSRHFLLFWPFCAIFYFFDIFFATFLFDILQSNFWHFSVTILTFYSQTFDIFQSNFLTFFSQTFDINFAQFRFDIFQSNFWHFTVKHLTPFRQTIDILLSNFWHFTVKILTFYCQTFDILQSNL